jgi:hypothetical protein
VGTSNFSSFTKCFATGNISGLAKAVTDTRIQHKLQNFTAFHRL